MLAFSLAFRQQSRCISTALSRSTAAFSSPQSPKNGMTPVTTSFSGIIPQQQQQQLLRSQNWAQVRSLSTTPVSRSGDHVKLWTAEKIVSGVAVPGLILPFIYTTPLTDALFCTLFVMHAHWGIEAIVVDYIRPVLFGGSHTIPNLCVAAVWGLSAFVLGALYYFNYTDVGVVNAIKMLWKV